MSGNALKCSRLRVSSTLATAILLAGATMPAEATRLLQIEGVVSQLDNRSGNWDPIAAAVGKSAPNVNFALWVAFPDAPVDNPYQIDGIVTYFRLGNQQMAGGTATLFMYPVAFDTAWHLSARTPTTAGGLSFGAGFDYSRSFGGIDFASTVFGLYNSDQGFLVFSRPLLTRFVMDGSLLNFPPLPTAPAPEPASWALMIGGLGLAGAAMRRRTAVSFV